MKDVDSNDITTKKDAESGIIKIVESEENISFRYKKKKKKKRKTKYNEHLIVICYSLWLNFIIRFIIIRFNENHN